MDTQRAYLKMVLDRSGMQVVSVVPVSERLLHYVEQGSVDAVLLELDENPERDLECLGNLLTHLHQQTMVPILFNDSFSAGPEVSAVDIEKN